MVVVFTVVDVVAAVVFCMCCVMLYCVMSSYVVITNESRVPGSSHTACVLGNMSTAQYTIATQWSVTTVAFFFVLCYTSCVCCLRCCCHCCFVIVVGHGVVFTVVDVVAAVVVFCMYCVMWCCVMSCCVMS